MKIRGHLLKEKIDSCWWLASGRKGKERNEGDSCSWFKHSRRSWCLLPTWAVIPVLHLHEDSAFLPCQSVKWGWNINHETWPVSLLHHKCRLVLLHDLLCGCWYQSSFLKIRGKNPFKSNCLHMFSGCDNDLHHGKLNLTVGVKLSFKYPLWGP